MHSVEKIDAACAHRRIPRIALCFAAPALSVALFAGLLLFSISATAQNQKNSKKKEADAPASLPAVPVPDAQAIDLEISQMLAAWQLDDVELLHKFYDDNVTVVSGVWEPPLLGWPAYLNSYQAQRARITTGQLDRSNTYTKVMGDSAWVTYQWVFKGQVDGQPSTFQGHTTLVLQKRTASPANPATWAIVLNHTSAIPPVQQESGPVAPPPSQGASSVPRSPGN